MRKIKEIKNKLFLTLLYAMILIVLCFFKVPCIFKSFLGIDCIGCGMTRAILSALKFDFKMAFTYHSMFWSIPILYLYFLYDGRIIGKKKLDTLVLLIILFGFIINWIFKIT